MARKTSRKSRSTGAANRLLDRLTPDEAKVLLGQLLDRHPELHSEVEKATRECADSPSAEEIAADVLSRVMGVGLDALNERAGAHSWGYVEPSQAAIGLLEEELDDLVEEMKRNAELGQRATAETVCIGIVEGLYRARNKQSDGALGWAPDFPAEHAGYLVSELLRSHRPSLKHTDVKRLIDSLRTQAPEWEEMFKRIAVESESAA